MRVVSVVVGPCPNYFSTNPPRAFRADPGRRKAPARNLYGAPAATTILVTCIQSRRTHSKRFAKLEPLADFILVLRCERLAMPHAVDGGRR
jgi:hypothetical protein